MYPIPNTMMIFAVIISTRISIWSRFLVTSSHIYIIFSRKNSTEITSSNWKCGRRKATEEWPESQFGERERERERERDKRDKQNKKAAQKDRQTNRTKRQHRLWFEACVWDDRLSAKNVRNCSRLLNIETENASVVVNDASSWNSFIFN